MPTTARPDVPALPDGLTARPLERTDARAVFELMAAEQQAFLGHVVIEEADIVGDWGRPSYDLAGSSLGVLDGDRLVGYAEVTGYQRGDAAVHPDQHGRGIGTALAGWMQALARSLGHPSIGMPVPVGSPGERLLRALGYRVRWSSWSLVLPDGAAIPDRALPGGHVIRPAVSAADREGAWHVIEDAFLEWSDREKDSWEDFAAGTLGRPGFEDWHLRVVVDGSGEVVGGLFLVMSPQADASTSAYVDRLAVRRDRRGQGLAQALLADAFAVAREHGATRSELSTDSRTGALDLYLGLGMVVQEDWVNLGIDL